MRFRKCVYVFTALFASGRAASFICGVLWVRDVESTAELSSASATVSRSVGGCKKNDAPLCVYTDTSSLSPSSSSNHGGLPLLCDVTLLTRVPVVCPSVLVDRLTLTLYRPNPVERIITKKKKKTGPERYCSVGWVWLLALCSLIYFLTVYISLIMFSSYQMLRYRDEITQPCLVISLNGQNRNQ